MARVGSAALPEEEARLRAELQERKGRRSQHSFARCSAALGSSWLSCGIGRGGGAGNVRVGGHCQTQLVHLCAVLPSREEPRASRFVSAPVASVLQCEHKVLLPSSSSSGRASQPQTSDAGTCLFFFF